MADYGQQVPALRRAIDVVELVAQSPAGLFAGAIADRVEGSRSGMYALLNTLKARDWLVQDESGAYLVGPGLRRVAGADDRDDRSLRQALDEALDPTFRESVALVRTDGQDRIVIAVHDGEHRVRSVHRLGQVRPDGTADGVVLRPDPPDDHGGRGGVPPDWPLPGVARTTHDDIVVLAAPVCRDGRRPVAAVVVDIPVQRTDDDQHLAAVAEVVARAARDTSVRLGAPTWQPWGRAVAPEPGPPRDLDQAEVSELLRGHHAAQLACLRDDGTPHSIPLWFDWDGEAFWLTASPGSAWASYLRDGSRVSLTVEEPRPNLRRVFVTGWARPVPDEVVARHVEGGIAGLRRRLLERSVGRGRPASVDDDAVGWTAIRLEPDRIHGRAGLGPVSA